LPVIRPSGTPASGWAARQFRHVCAVGRCLAYVATAADVAQDIVLVEREARTERLRDGPADGLASAGDDRYFAVPFDFLSLCPVHSSHANRIRLGCSETVSLPPARNTKLPPRFLSIGLP
jgi:hypothetical protein